MHDDETHNNEILVGIQIANAGNKIIKFKVDSGAQVNILPKSLFKASLNHIALENTKVSLSAFGGSEVPLLRKCKLRCHYRDRCYELSFYVADCFQTHSKVIL